MWEGFASGLLGGLANLGGGFMSASGAASANQQQQRMQNMYNQQMLAHAQYQQQMQYSMFHEAQAQQEKSQVMSQDFNAGEALKQRQWTENMSNTAYQRAMADMRSAGLNPLLAYQQGGAPAGGGSAASASGGSVGPAGSGGSPNLQAAKVENTQGELGRAIGRTVSTAVDAMKTMEGVDLMKKQGALTDENTRKVGYETTQMDAATGKILADTNVSKVEEQNRRILNQILKAQSSSAASRAAIDAREAKDVDQYGSKAAPDTLERILRSIQGHVEKFPAPRIELQPKEW